MRPPNGGSGVYQSAADAECTATKQGESALLVSPTSNEVGAITEKVRDTLKDQVGSVLRMNRSPSWIRSHRRRHRRRKYKSIEPATVPFSATAKALRRGETDGEETCRRFSKTVCASADLTAAKLILSLAAVTASFDVGGRGARIESGSWGLAAARRPIAAKRSSMVSACRCGRCTTVALPSHDGRVLLLVPTRSRTVTQSRRTRRRR